MTANTVSWGGNSAKFAKPADADPSTLAAPAAMIVALPTNGTAFPAPRKIIGDKAGTATVTDYAGNVIPGFPITGQEQSLALTAISALVTTTKVWGQY